MESMILKESFIEKNKKAWSALLEAVKKDKTASDEAKTSGITLSGESFVNKWLKENWGIVVTWGLLIFFTLKITSPAPKRNHHRKGSKYNPY